MLNLANSNMIGLFNIILTTQIYNRIRFPKSIEFLK